MMLIQVYIYTLNKSNLDDLRVIKELNLIDPDTSCHMI